MSFNQFGKILKLTTFGESHGIAIGGILDGMPAGIHLDVHTIRNELNRRRPGQSALTTSRQESEDFQLLSGLKDHITTGHSIGFLIHNHDQKSRDYDSLSNKYRPSHADFTYHQKYGIRDDKGGGRSSARETANWVLAGAIAKHLIPNIEINSYVSSIGAIRMNDQRLYSRDEIEASAVRCPDSAASDEMAKYILHIKEAGDSVGGIITTVVNHMPIGLGEPIFSKLSAHLAHAMMTINAVKGFEIGSGFETSNMLGSQCNDTFLSFHESKTNHSGGIQGGISNGMNLVFRTAFKPTSSIAAIQSTIDHEGHATTIQVEGRHDPCVVPRAVPIVDALTSLVLADFYLLNQIRKIG